MLLHEYNASWSNNIKKNCFLFLHYSQILSAKYITHLQEKEGENMIKQQYNSDIEKKWNENQFNMSYKPQKRWIHL